MRLALTNLRSRFSGSADARSRFRLLLLPFAGRRAVKRNGLLACLLRAPRRNMKKTALAGGLPGFQLIMRFGSTNYAFDSSSSSSSSNKDQSSSDFSWFL